jgi:hypothetical protein
MAKTSFGVRKPKSLPFPHRLPETDKQIGRQGTFMTANREQFNQGFELTGRRRFALRTVASFCTPDFDQVCLLMCSRSNSTINCCCAFASDEPEPPRPVF